MDKLTKVGILIKAVFPTWIANSVKVKKHDGAWCMCIDYSYLNKAYPKDCYPLPDEQSLLADAKETLRCLEKVKMKPNPTKCTFRVEKGQFWDITLQKKESNPALPR